jgi:hypothetical protein
MSRKGRDQSRFTKGLTCIMPDMPVGHVIASSNFSFSLKFMYVERTRIVHASQSSPSDAKAYMIQRRNGMLQFFPR